MVGAELRGVTSVSRFIFLSFAFMGWAFYEVSGGPDFKPQITATLATIDQAAQPPAASDAAPVFQLGVRPAPEPPKEIPALITTRMVRTDQRGDTTLLPDGASRKTPKLVFSLSAYDDVAPEIKRIRSENVNMRTGPGTKFVVVDTLAMDSRVKLLDGSVDGWVKLRSLDSGRVGWVHRRFVSYFAG